MAEDIPAGGTWVDTYALHFPPQPVKPGRFRKGVGSQGYDRGTGVEVPTHPRLVRPGDSEAAADPFGAQHHAEEPAEGKAKRPERSGASV